MQSHQAAVAEQPLSGVRPLKSGSFETRITTGNARLSSRRWLSIGEVAREFAITLRALRFYESKGLIAPLRQGSQRLYSPTDRARIGLILSAKDLGFTLAEIADLISKNGEANELALSPDMMLRQIAFLEKQHAQVETALAALRMRYYTLTEKDEAGTA
jgi:DNA-binding transcriptional MerR regulator